MSLYVFSTENWSRPKEEINGLFQLLAEVIHEEVEIFQREGVRLRHCGSLQGVPLQLAEKVRWAVDRTKNNRQYTLNIAFNYGGRADILQAARRILADGVRSEDLSEELFSRYLLTAELPDIDLVIRTGGELRLSNFFLWQSAFAVMYVTPVYWPDFDEKELQKAIAFFSDIHLDKRHDSIRIH